MSIDLTGITNKNEYYTNHYFATVFEENASSTISSWNAAAKEAVEFHTPWSLLRQNARQYYAAHDRFVRSSMNLHALSNIRTLADSYLATLGYPEAKPEVITVNDTLTVPVYLEMTKSNGAPLLWVILSASKETDTGIMESYAFNSADVEEDANGALYKGILNEMPNEDLATKILFGSAEPPRFLVFISMNQIALIDRNKWNEKRYLQFELEEIFSRLENTTLQAMAVLLHKDSLCPDDGKILLDELDEQSHKNASGVSQNLKYALRESIELLGNEVLYDMAHRLGRDLEVDPVDAGKLTLECLRYMYRMLFVLFIESRPELGYAPIKAQTYYSGYSLESLRDIADNIREDVAEVGNGYYLHDTLAKLYELIYDGYPKTEEELRRAAGSDSLHDMFLIAPLKAHIFDPEYTEMITAARLRNSCMLRIIDLMSLTKSTGKKNDRRGRISYANLGINQMGAVYEALLSYRGFIAEHDLYEVKRAGDNFNELDVGYFVTEAELDQYTEDERVRYETGEKKGKLRMYEKGTFIYRLAGREREKSASYYTPEVLTKCLVKYALKELLEGKTADDILKLTICEPAMGSAAFLNEAINQLAEAYISRKEKETGDIISYEKRFNELQKVKMYIADRNVYGIDLNPVAVELAEVSLWLNTIYEGGFVPWFGTQLVNGNSLIGARRQCYRVADVQATSKGLRWYEKEPERAPLNAKKMLPKRIFHFLLGDPGMCSYTDKVIKSLEPENIKKMADWNKRFIAPYSKDDTETLLALSKTINALWKAQIRNRKMLEDNTHSTLSVYGHQDSSKDSMTSIREKDKFLHIIYKSEHAQNAGPYARLKFAMDYWCSLWFWPIEQADMLPSRSEFLNDMNLILVGVIQTQRPNDYHQVKLFDEGSDDEEENIWENTEVNLDQLCQLFPRLALVRGITEQNKFMHWELEFADLFEKCGGFDLVIGNPPWIKIQWNEQSVLADKNPMFAVKKLNASQTAQNREAAMENRSTYDLYFAEYESLAGELSFLDAIQNYADLKGQQTNLFKCFLPQAWNFNNKCGVSAFVHPEGVYDDPKGGVLREKLYTRLRKHFMFANERKLFLEVDHHTQFSLNVYGSPQMVSFDTICNLYDVSSIVQCYEGDIFAPIPGIKDDNGEWNVQGHPKRIIHVTKKELQAFATVFEGNTEWRQTKLPSLHESTQMEVLEKFAEQTETVGTSGLAIQTTKMWDETNSQKNGVLTQNICFPESNNDTIFVGAYCSLGNPYFQTVRRKYISNSDYDTIDLTQLNEYYYPRTKYTIACDKESFISKIPGTPWGDKFNANYTLVNREFVGTMSERTLTACLLPPKSTFICTLFGVALQDVRILSCLCACENSLPYDFLVKIIGKNHVGYGTIKLFPLFDLKKAYPITLRGLLLNALTAQYAELWRECWQSNAINEAWAKNEPRLRPEKFSSLTSKWNWNIPIRTDYERRQALIEIDVLTAMALGMTLEQLKTIYRIQFPVLQSYEAGTWYDANGRIVFTNNRSLTGVGFDRITWENEVKDAPAGRKFYRTITDDTMPGGPVERTIEYIAPFDRCDREQDYETAWKFFEEKYGK
ncbi:N-6 DNA methylase [Clostridium sp. AM58-1XD]|uniref:Eco57I restriction-modification methylase domain-containing protein n=1 Tax=Clostridium sp. AM58-1XD TaxID=2292307 RepID=UPI000E47D25F|nr:N-6 DNA methylase [Clostridium sp. AM58-1XD]RGZ00925.1 class I SAM-dependent DNA methyltransferase [Clostridium sp. AM58-1XD]